ncbi:hypothetical protein BH24PSE2_BH24PSE2_08770 [soil metagenome]
MTMLRRVLLSMLPVPQQTILLQACLGSAEVAAEGWRGWLDHVRDPRSAFERDQEGIKGLLPFIRYSLNKHEIEVPAGFRVYLQVSSVREELRSRIYRQILGDTLSALRAAGCDVIALRAAALSESVYETNDLRHNHAIELLIRPSDVDRATEALKNLPFEHQEPRRAWQRHVHQYIHTTGLPLVLHTALLLLPHYRAGSDDIWANSESAVLGGVESRMLSPCENLINVCGHASYSRGRMNLRWVCDAVLILRRHPEIEWESVIQRVRQYRLVLPLAVMFEFLAQQLEAPIPQPVLTDLKREAESANRSDREAAILGVMLGAATPVSAIRRLPDDLPSRALCARHFLFPSRTYMQWRYGYERRWLLPAAYLYRLARFGSAALSRRNRRSLARSGARAVADVD